MLEGLFGNETVEKVLWYLTSNDEGYARAMAQSFDISLSTVQNTLDRLERGGVLVSRLAGKTRLYTWNPRWPFQDELRGLLSKSLDYLPPQLKTRYERRRPRRRGKPL